MPVADLLREARRRPLAALALAVYSLAVAKLVFEPAGSTAGAAVTRVADLLVRLGAPTVLTSPARVEVMLNVVMLAPLPVLGMLVWPRSNWRDWTAAAFATSLTIELLQIPHPTRGATFSDLAANTAGGFIGAVTWTVVRHVARRRAGASARDGARHDV